MLDLVTDALEVPTQVLNVFKQPSSLRVETMHTIFDLVMSTIPAEEALKDEKNRNL